MLARKNCTQNTNAKIDDNVHFVPAFASNGIFGDGVADVNVPPAYQVAEHAQLALAA